MFILFVPVLDRWNKFMTLTDHFVSSEIHFSDNPMKVEQLVLAFVQHGPGISDPAANQALALALAKLSQEKSYMAVIEKLGLLRGVLELLLKLLDLHKDSLLLQESCCIAVCRIALRIDSLSVPEKERIASVFFNMLETDDQYVLGSTISGICALGTFQPIYVYYGVFVRI